MNDEMKICFALMTQEQAEERRFHELLAVECAEHPGRSMDENLKAVTKKVIIK